MIVNEVHVKGVLLFEAEYDPPIGSDRNRPVASAITLEAMKAKARGVHILDRLRHVQPGQDAPYFVDVFGGKLSPVVLLK